MELHGKKRFTTEPASQGTTDRIPDRTDHDARGGSERRGI